MKTLHRMVLRQLAPILIASMVFFVLLLELVDLFPNLPTYIEREVPLTTVLSVAGLYAPKCLVYSIPVALVFAVSFTMGTLYRNNELVAIIGAGISLRNLIIPIVGLGALLSAFSFFFGERVVIDTLANKNEIHQQAVRRVASLSNANVVVISDDGSAVYQAEFFDDTRSTLRGLVVLQHRPPHTLDDPNPVTYRRYDAQTAQWQDGKWTLSNVTLISWRADGEFEWSRVSSLAADFISEGPETFQKPTRKVDEMRVGEAREWVHRLQRSGLPYLEALTEYYARYFFSLTPLIVTILACSVGGRIRKNVLLMNLLLSLILSVIYYVTHMVAVILAKNGVVPPLLGAGAATIILLVGGVVAVRSART